MFHVAVSDHDRGRLEFKLEAVSQRRRFSIFLNPITELFEDRDGTTASKHISRYLGNEDGSFQEYLPSGAAEEAVDKSKSKSF